MAYDGSQLHLVEQLIGGRFRKFVYMSADQFSDVDATDYFALAYHTHQMREGDLVTVVETDTDPPNITQAYVNAIDSDGNATVAAVSYAGAITASSVAIPVGTATATAGAATLNAVAGKVTSESLTTAQNAIYTLTITNSTVAAGDMVFASVANGTNTQGTPQMGRVTPGSSSIAIQVINKHATSEAFNGTIVVSYLVIKAAA